MIKFIARKRDGTTALGLVLSDQNIEYMRDLKPIIIHAHDLGRTEIKCDEILIAVFASEEEAVEFFKTHGAITESTIIKGPPTKH